MACRQGAYELDKFMPVPVRNVAKQVLRFTIIHETKYTETDRMLNIICCYAEPCISIVELTLLYLTNSLVVSR